MPRRARHWVPTCGAHLISRFVDRRFHLVDRVDREGLLDAIARAHDRWDWDWLSYALMSTHVHYGLLAGSVDPDRFFRSTHTRFAQRYHRRPARESTLGPVFADRPAIFIVQPSDLPKLVAYHHRNPMEAGVVARPRDSSWTSHRAYLRLDPAPPWLDVERGLDLLGFSDTAAGRSRFDEWVMEVDLTDRPWVHPSEPPGEPVGSSGPPTVDWDRLKRVAREVAGLKPGKPLTTRTPRAALARRLLVLVATRDLGQTYATVGAELGMRPSSAFNLVARAGRMQTQLEPGLAELRRRLAAVEPSR